MTKNEKAKLMEAFNSCDESQQITAKALIDRLFYWDGKMQELEKVLNKKGLTRMSHPSNEADEVEVERAESKIYANGLKNINSIVSQLFKMLPKNENQNLNLLDEMRSMLSD